MTEDEWSDFDHRRVDPHYGDGFSPWEILTEEGWLASTDTQRMLEVFVGKNRDRKFRLFACACCRDIWVLLRDEQDRRAVEVAERFADGEATLEELVIAHDGCFSARTAGAYASNDRRWEDMLYAACCCSGETNRRARKKSSCRQAIRASFLRDIFGNPFHPITLDPAWKTPTIVALARSIYDSRVLPAGTFDPGGLAILGDALEVVGCTNADILNHCRQATVHVRGCWLVDLLLDRE